MKFLKTPVVRISTGIMLLTVSLLMVADFIGLAPNQEKVAFEARKNLCESLALQFSAAAQQGNIASIKATIKALTARNNDILSVALRSQGGRIMAVSGDHLVNWQPPVGGASSINQVQVPILQGRRAWGTVEIRFAPLGGDSWLGGILSSFWALVLFVAVTGFVGYFFLMKRTLRELDPAAVVPARVREAFDVLKEGVLILDEQEHIVMANAAFSTFLSKEPDDLVGFKGSELGWRDYHGSEDEVFLPWLQVMAEGKTMTGVALSLESTAGQQTQFMVNAAPVMDGNGKCRGTLVTFDDVTELEGKNLQLNKAVTDLQVSSDKISAKNEELEFLASHDPMTKLLNRRAFNDRFSKLFNQAREQGQELSCIMCDIDHFKAVNDNYGHGVGDEVIKSVANVLSAKSRDIDLVGRYGGEEFCLVFVGLDLGRAAEIARRIRQTIANNEVEGIKVTMSFGVSSLLFKAHDPTELSNQADRALYVAKESGRNRVVRWGGDEGSSLGEQNEVQTQENQTILDDPAEIERLMARVSELEVVAEKRSQELKHFIAYDPRTGLPTHSLFLDRIIQAQARANRYDHVVAVLSVSVHSVSRVREVLGHEVAGKLLNSIGLRLLEILRSNDTVALMTSKYTMPTVSLLGQDEFGVLLTDLEEVDHIVWIIKRIIDSLQKIFVIDDEEMYVSPHVGISISSVDGDSAEVLVKNATAASRQVAEGAGHEKYRFYSPDINDASARQLQIEAQLHQAIANDEFLLYFQPKVDVATAAIVGLEALIRWNSPQMGLVSPSEFIPLAEDSGLINDIGDWVLVATCQQIRSWHDMGLTACTVAINFSAKQFRHNRLVSRIKEVLEVYQLDPACLEIEVTESAMMEDRAKSSAVLQEMRAMGLAVAIDDFGTGYSSLGYLKKLPVTHLKLDCSFVAGIAHNDTDASLVGSIIQMAHIMGLKVVAEGVEDQAQATILTDFSCDEFQGNLFSIPLPAQETTTLLQTGLAKDVAEWQIA